MTGLKKSMLSGHPAYETFGLPFLIAQRETKKHFENVLEFLWGFIGGKISNPKVDSSQIDPLMIN